MGHSGNLSGQVNKALVLADLMTITVTCSLGKEYSPSPCSYHRAGKRAPPAAAQQLGCSVTLLANSTLQRIG
jgi:hypothetical protein